MSFCEQNTIRSPRMKSGLFFCLAFGGYVVTLKHPQVFSTFMNLRQGSLTEAKGSGTETTGPKDWACV